ncbi:MAG: PLP-dependent transferase, partial [Pseudomonadota bacterium]
MSRNRSIGDDTILTQGGRQRNDETDFAAVNPAVHRASTVLFDNMADFMHRQERAYDGYPYGTSGTPTARSLEKAIAALENGTRSIVTSSGMTAIGLCLLTFLKSGDHVLVPDCVYGTTRAFCDRLLKRLDISATFYDPTIGERVDDLIGPDTSMLLLEAPGSLTLEMQDIPAMVQVARQKNVLTVMDNTWASPL